jgi:two-component system NarL family sensor kinase
LVTFIFAILFLYQKRNILFMKRLEETKNIYEKSLLQTQLEIQEQTFQDIAREIHDNIGLSLTLAKLQLNTLDYNNIINTKENTRSSVELISKAIRDLSDISKGLHSESIQTNGLYDTLKMEADRITRSGNYRVEFNVGGTPAFLDAQKELVLYRITQEALNNILKHAAATEIILTLQYESSKVTLCIKDNGMGFDPNALEKKHSKKTMMGLNNMRTRAAMINGLCSINSAIGNGTTICVTTSY